MGGFDELRRICRERTVAGGEFLFAGRRVFGCDLYDVYGKCASYFLWPVFAGALCKDGEKEAVYDFFPDR